MNSKTLAVCLAVCVSVVGCSTAPVERAITTTRTYSDSYDHVWGRIIEFFAVNNIPLKNIAKDSGVVFAENTRFDSAVADCGDPGPLAHSIRRSASFNVFVNRSTGKLTVSVNARFSDIRMGVGAAITTVECSSKGTLERRILDFVGT